MLNCTVSENTLQKTRRNESWAGKNLCKRHHPRRITKDEHTKIEKSRVPGLLDDLIAKITVNAYGDDEQLWAFRQAFVDNMTLPADSFIN